MLIYDLHVVVAVLGVEAGEAQHGRALDLDAGGLAVRVGPWVALLA